VIIVFP